MNLKTRLTVKFLSQVFLLVVLVSAVWGGTIFWVQYSEEVIPQQNEMFDVLSELEKTTEVQDGRATVPPQTLAKLAPQSWVQVLSGDGRELFAYRKPSNIPERIGPGELAFMRENPHEYGYALHTWYKGSGENSVTWVYALPFDAETQLSIGTRFLILVLGGSLLLAVLVAFLFGRQLGAPLLHMMNWLKNIASGELREPVDADGIARSRNPSGNLRRGYRLYRDVLNTLERVTDALQANEEERARLDRTREEWMAGVSHDMKTPLSSVKGYAELLATEQYSWSEAEVREFGHVISEKAKHMELLLEDLNLTFQLRNKALPMERRLEDVVEVARQSVIHLINHPQTSNQEVVFASAEQPSIFYPLDRGWFSRALDNLLVNAAKHNPPGTRIEVEVLRAEDGGVRIRIADNGVGMDAQTLEHLFDRYYRGTSTASKESAGSGLGTAIAKHLVEAHEGQLEVQSTVGAGTTIVVSLPPVPSIDIKKPLR
ncbi:sensor histidine kinase [Tumebacillus flagellatus]|uniref:histidine kinase n=1 Tax=Tumebacillus flagellatus TaxID=1157490 RepID=A0A074LPP1_9BACL|nr:HAMP domain-containing sensor histidine kinase [Tumebacillus flagellatus]KEO82465.1 hypothetical protein EL26_15415 [Tumebacillus flagellatus]